MQQTPPSIPPISPWRIFWIFTSIGLQSIGGGASTTLLMQQRFIDKYKWLTAEEFAYLWSLCQLAPGINLVGFSILVGKRMGGILGMFSAVLGLMVPSAIVTCLLAAGFKKIEYLPTTRAIEQGVIPATAAIMLMVGINFSIPPIKKARSEGLFPVILTVGLILLYTVAIISGVPVAVVLLSGGLLGILFFTRPLWSARKDSRS
jgi:Chromate transport protein ChrA